MDVDYGDDDDGDIADKIKSAQFGVNSKLDKSIQELIKLIFDIEKMKSALIEYEIDTNKMPLGKLSSDQLKKALKVLTELTEVCI